MGKIKTHVFSKILIALLGLPLGAYGDSSFPGCPDWCRSLYGNAGPMAYESCMFQTKKEGYCGKKAITVPIPTPRPDIKPPTNATSGSTGYVCEDVYNSLIESCESSIQETTPGCDYQSNTQMNSLSSSVAQLAITLSSKKSAAIRENCSEMLRLSNAAATALNSFRTQCTSAISSCKSTCQEITKFARENSDCFTGSGQGSLGMNPTEAVRKGETAILRCDTFAFKLTEANQAIQSHTQNSASSAACEQATNGGEGSPDNEFCKSNPQAPGCNPYAQANCEDPQQAKTNKVCICSREPYSPECQAASQSSYNNAEVGNGNWTDSSSRLGGGSGGDNSFADGFENSMKHGALPSGGSGDGLDGKQGAESVVGDVSLRGGGLKAANTKGTSTENSGDGTLGAGSGGKFYGPGNLNQDSSSSAYSRTTASATSAKSETTSTANPDLRKFLPGGIQDPRNRGLAGTSGPDGITGPHSDIWKKIQNRYRVVSPTLIDP